MKLSSIKLSVIGAAIFVVTAAPIQASAQTAAPRQGPPPLRVACGAEMQSLCPGLKGKDARMCLRAHHATLSPGCTAFLEEAKARRAAGTMGQPPAPADSPPPGNGNQ